MMDCVRDAMVLEHMRAREAPMAVHAADLGLTSSELGGALRNLQAKGKIVRVRRKYGHLPTLWRVVR